MNYYVLVVWEDVEPELFGPYDEALRDERAREIKRVHGDKHGIYALDVQGEAKVFAYSGGFFKEEA